jgi:putative FmdB family regulatory protein
MPTYQYHCDGCGQDFERFQSITARLVRKCPNCGKRSVRRLIGAGAGIIFKGSGFYQTDYRSDSYTKAAEKEKRASVPSEGPAKAKAKPEGESSKKAAE